MFFSYEESSTIPRILTPEFAIPRNCRAAEAPTARTGSNERAPSNSGHGRQRHGEQRALLGVLFESEFAGSQVFKGGTSLSKVFGAIERFSKDIDLSLSPAFLKLPEAGTSRNQGEQVDGEGKGNLRSRCAKPDRTCDRSGGRGGVGKE
jgi:hypothetical protein